MKKLLFCTHIKFLYVILLTVLFISLFSCSNSTKIGVILSSDETAANIVNLQEKIISLRTNQFNANLLNKNSHSKISLLFEYAVCNEAQANSAISRLVAKKVVAIIGSPCDAVAQSILPHIKRTKTPFISPSISDPEWFIPNLTFQTTSPDNNEANTIIKLIKNLNLNSVNFVVSDETYSRELYSYIRTQQSEIPNTQISFFGIDRKTKIADVKASKLFQFKQNTKDSIVLLSSSLTPQILEALYSKNYRGTVILSNINNIYRTEVRAIKARKSIFDIYELKENLTQNILSSDSYQLFLNDFFTTHNYRPDPKDYSIILTTESAISVLLSTIAHGAKTKQDVSNILNSSVVFSSLLGDTKFNNLGVLFGKNLGYSVYR